MIRSSSFFGVFTQPVVPVANQYRWCSAAWFERVASPAQVKTICGFKIDQLKVYDDF